MDGGGQKRDLCPLRCRRQDLSGGSFWPGRARRTGRRAAVFKGRGCRPSVAVRQHAGDVQQKLRQLGGHPAGILPHHGDRAGQAVPAVGHRDRAGRSRRSGGAEPGAERRPDRVRRGRGLAAGALHPAGRVFLRHTGAERRRRPVAEHGRQAAPQCGDNPDGIHGAPGAGAGFCDRVRQPGVGLQQQGECYLRLQAGRPHQLVQLPGHRGGQLRRHRGQRRCLYRGSLLHGLCVVL